MDTDSAATLHSPGLTDGSRADEQLRVPACDHGNHGEKARSDRYEIDATYGCKAESFEKDSFALQSRANTPELHCRVSVTGAHEDIRPQMSLG